VANCLLSAPGFQDSSASRSCSSVRPHYYFDGSFDEIGKPLLTAN
jgi:hypothetical protein